MKNRFGKLSKVEQERIELEYHHMDPHEFDEQMSKARKYVVTSIRLPVKMVKTLKVVAELEGEREYQVMVRKWIEERLRQEVRVVLRLSKIPDQGVVAILKQQAAK